MAASSGAQGGAAPPPRVARHEKQEKQEKNEKGEKHEKGRGGDLAGAITGGLVLILLGVLLYFATTATMEVTFSNFWEYFLVGIGVILIIQGAVRYAERRVLVTGSFIAGGVLIIVGLAFLSTVNFAVWPLILVVLGLAAIVSAFSSRRRAPAP